MKRNDFVWKFENSFWKMIHGQKVEMQKFGLKKDQILKVQMPAYSFYRKVCEEGVLAKKDEFIPRVKVPPFPRAKLNGRK